MLHPTKPCLGFVSAALRVRRAGVAVAIALLSFGLAAPMGAQVFVTKVSAPSPGNYDRTLALHFTAKFSAPVVVQGAPRLALRVGNRIRHATSLPPLGPAPAVTSLTFVYHPEAFDTDLDGITVVPQLDLNGGAIRGMDTTPARLGFSPPDTRGVYVTLRPPPAPRILGLTSVAGFNPTPVASGNAFVLRGTADAGSRVTVSLVDVARLGSTTTAANGAWSIPYPTSLLSPGTHRLVAEAENSAGLLSAPSEPLELKVSTAPGR